MKTKTKPLMPIGGTGSFGLTIPIAWVRLLGWETGEVTLTLREKTGTVTIKTVKRA